MSRSGYSEDCDNLELYRGTVTRTINGKKGQAFLRDLAAALDAMPVKELIEGELVDSEGRCCAIGAVCKARNMTELPDYEDSEAVGKAMGITWQLAAELAFLNDDDFGYPNDETPEQRWQRMRKWASDHLRTGAVAPASPEDNRKAQPPRRKLEIIWLNQ